MGSHRVGHNWSDIAVAVETPVVNTSCFCNMSLHAQNVIVSGDHISTLRDLLSEESLSFTSWRRSFWTEDLWHFKIHIWNLINKTKIFGGEAFGRWLGHECEAIMNGVNALARSDMREMISPSLSTIWDHSQKAAICKTEWELSSGKNWPATLILNISASRTVRITC